MQLMKWCFVLFLLLMSFSGVAELQGKEKVYARLLLSENVLEIKLGAKALYNDLLADPLLWDLAAHKLWSLTNSNDAETIDTAAWLAKAIGRSQQARYRTLLEKLNADTQGKKLTKYLTESLNKLGDPTQPQFDPTDYTLAEVQAAVNAEVDKITPTQQAFDRIVPGAPLDGVLKMLGQPDGVGQYIRRINRPFIGGQVFQNLRLSYLNLGSMELHYENNIWLVRTKSVQADTDLTELDSQYQDLASRLLSKDRVQVIAAAREAIAIKLSDIETLDHIAKHIWDERSTEDRHLADSLAWLCKVLAASNNGRYKQMLATLEDHGATKKIVKYARSAANELPASTESFNPEN